MKESFMSQRSHTGPEAYTILMT